MQQQGQGQQWAGMMGVGCLPGGLLARCSCQPLRPTSSTSALNSSKGEALAALQFWVTCLYLCPQRQLLLFKTRECSTANLP